MIRRYAMAALFGLLAALWEASVSPFLPVSLSIRPLLPLVVLLLVASSRPRALTAAFAGGVILDAYAIGAFDVAAIRWVAVVLLLDFVARQFLTNRSIYATAALAVIGRVAERLLAWAIGIAASFLAGTVTAPAGMPWQSFVWDVVLAGFGFLALASLTRRFVAFSDEGARLPDGQGSAFGGGGRSGGSSH